MRKTLVMAALVASFALGYAVNSWVGTKSLPERGRVTGIGGIFFKAKNPKVLKDWYSRNLGLNMDQYGTLFEWRPAGDCTRVATSQWSVFNEKTKYFLPSTRDFMINYRVNNLELLLTQLKRDSVMVVDSILTVEYGKFLHIMDPEGNKIELWEPIDWKFDRTGKGITR